MNISPSSPPARRELLTVDLRGLQRALHARSASTGRSAAAIVREALASALGDEHDASMSRRPYVEGLDRVRVSLRLTRQEAEELTAGAATAGLSLGRYVVALMRSGHQPESAALRKARIAALTRSNAELSTLSLNLARLGGLLRQGSTSAAQEYAHVLTTLQADIRGYLAKASGLLGE